MAVIIPGDINFQQMQRYKPGRVPVINWMSSQNLNKGEKHIRVVTFLLVLLQSIKVSHSNTFKEGDDKKRDVSAEVIKDGEDVVSSTICKHQGEDAAGSAY